MRTDCSSAIRANREAELFAEEGEVEIDHAGHREDPAEGFRVRGRAAREKTKQARGRHEVREDRVREREGDAEVCELCEPEPHGAIHCPGPCVSPDAHLARALEETLDAAIDEVEQHRLRTRPPAPDASEPRGHADEPETDPSEQKEEEPRVLRVEV